jgi:L-amino acid N-acyltransferase YncA
MIIREAQPSDTSQIWRIFHEIAYLGETYAYPRNITQAEAMKLWLELPRKTYVAEENAQIGGTYYIKTNQLGGGSHVCNCGYMVATTARGKGLATALCEHSQKVAIELGYKAMQFNFVISTNQAAIRLWSKLGFDTVGCLPKAFNHPKQGYVDALVMYKWLSPS